MIRLKLLIILLALFISVGLGISVEGIEQGPGQKGIEPGAPQHELEAVVRGAVEDWSWFYSGTREEVYSALGRYYGGALLEELALKTWEFVSRPTDWHSLARVKEVRVVYFDGKSAVAEAIISIEDVDTGHNETGKGLFAMSMTAAGWRVFYASYSWNEQPRQGNICYNGECTGSGEGGFQ